MDNNRNMVETSIFHQINSSYSFQESLLDLSPTLK